MRRTLFSLLGATLALAVTAGWEWAAGPAVVPLPGADPGPCSVGRPSHDPAGRFVDVYQVGDRPKFWVYDAPAGRLGGPWTTPDRIAWLAFDAAGQLHLLNRLDPSEEGPLVVRRLDAGGGMPVVWGRPDAIGVRLLDPPGGPAAVVLSGGPGRPLRAELLDLFTGAVRGRLDFPDRRGVVARRGRELAAADWAVSADGRLLALSEGWAGNARVGPPGVEVWAFAGGRRVGRLAEPDRPADRGARDLSLSADGREVEFRPFRRNAAADDEPEDAAEAWDWQAGVRRPDPPGPPHPAAHSVARTDDGLTLWQRPVGEERVAVRVTAADGRPTADWVELDGDRVSPGAISFAAGGRSVLFQSATDPPELIDWGRNQLGLPAAAGRAVLTTLDWRTGRVRYLRSHPNGADDHLDSTSLPGRLVTVVADAGGARLEVWPDPPRPAPPAWLWPVAGVAGGVAGWAVGWRPRRRPDAPAGKP